MRRSLAIGLAVAAVLALPGSAGAVLSGTNGRVVYISGPAFGNTQLFLRTVIGSTGGGTRSGPIATGLPEQHRHPTWSPDRTQIAFAHGAPAGPFTIYTFDLTTPGAIPQPLGLGDRPAWSPDGTRIAYENGDDVFVRTLDPGGTVNLTSTLAPRAWKVAWSADSQTVYYSVGDISVAPNAGSNDVRIYQQPADNSSAGTELLHIGGAHVFQPSISPDGTKLCYTTSTQGSNLPTSAAILAAPLSSPTTFTIVADTGKGDYNCAWSPDGTKIVYTDDYAGNGEVLMSNADGSSMLPINLSDAAMAFDGNPDWAPDGRPICPDSAVDTTVNTPITFQVNCTDTGPAYEQSDVREVKLTDPAHGTLTQEFAGDPFTYAPNQGFVGTDSFQVRGIDEVGFGTDTGTVTIRVPTPPPPPPPVRCEGRTATIVGTAGADTLAGTPGRDVIAALGGNDTIRGGRGNDLICAGTGRDRVRGGSGRDRVLGGSGGDRLLGDGGNDTLIGNGGPDTLIGGPGRDRLAGGSGRDRLTGGSGPDRLNGGSARDRCSGGTGRDRGSRCERRSSIP